MAPKARVVRCEKGTALYCHCKSYIQSFYRTCLDIFVRTFTRLHARLLLHVSDLSSALLKAEMASKLASVMLPLQLIHLISWQSNIGVSAFLCPLLRTSQRVSVLRKRRTPYRRSSSRAPPSSPLLSSIAMHTHLGYATDPHTPRLCEEIFFSPNSANSPPGLSTDGVLAKQGLRGLPIYYKIINVVNV